MMNLPPASPRKPAATSVIKSSAYAVSRAAHTTATTAPKIDIGMPRTHKTSASELRDLRGGQGQTGLTALQQLQEQAARIDALEQALQDVRAQLPQGLKQTKRRSFRRISIRATSKRLARALRRQVFGFDLEPMQGVERAGTDRRTFRRPERCGQFALTALVERLPYGWVKVQARFIAKGDAKMRLSLCFDCGDGFRVTNSRQLTLLSANSQTIEAIHFFPPSVQQLRLDVVAQNEGDVFELSALTVQEITKQQALAELMKRSAQQRPMPLRRLPRLAAKWTRHLGNVGIAGCLELLHNPKEQPSMLYTDWVERYDSLFEADRAAILARIQTLAVRPKISIVMPIYNTPADYLSRAIESVRSQLYENWELCLADDASDAPHIAHMLHTWACADARIKTVRRKQQGHICATSNDALALASGTFVVFLDHDDELREHALFLLAETINTHPDVKLIYSDEDKLDVDGQRCDPSFKPDWNPDLLRSQNYINHLSCFHLDSVRAVGSLRLGYEGSQDYDLLLRLTHGLAPHHIQHIAHVLYQWRRVEGSTAHTPNAKPYTFEAATRALTEDLERRGQDGTISLRPDGYFRTRYTLPKHLPLVSIIIPTRDQVKLLRQCVQSIRTKTHYEHYEIIIVDNDSAELATQAYFKSLNSDRRVRVMPYHKVFNYAAINNAAAAAAEGDILCLLNNDVEVINEEWLDELVSQALRPEIGAVGAKLLYNNKTLQHAGVVLGLGGIAGHAHKYASGSLGPADLVRNYAAVTGACLAIRRDTYQKVGGLNESLRVAFNDVDFCLRVGELGLRNLYTPYAQLFHHESATRGTDFSPAKMARLHQESALMRERWGDRLTQDPHYNPNLTLKREDFSLAWPPRAAKPWVRGDGEDGVAPCPQNL